MKAVFEEKFKTFIFLTSVFFIHRLISFSDLNSGSLTEYQQFTKAITVGLLSDIWVAALFSLVLFLILTPIYFTPFSRVILDRVSFVYIFTISLLVILHQSYVEFYKFQIIPLHLNYLLDVDFLRANSSSILSLATITTLFLVIVMYFFSFKLFKLSTLSTKAKIVSSILLIIFAVTAHMTNIHWRVQLFIPDNLQTNLFERLYLSLKVSRTPKVLTVEDQMFLQTMLQKRGVGLKELLLTKPPVSLTTRDWPWLLKDLFNKKIQLKQKPIVEVIVLESMRACDLGVYSDLKKPTLSPHLDALAARSIVFKNAYSTGTVTRGAQEAVWCGYLGSQNTSMMRNRLDVQMTCLPKLISKNINKKADVFWHHGGQPAFDNQVDFWKKQDVARFISQKDFATETPKTDWGYSDLALFKKSFLELQRSKNTMQGDYFLGMVLTMTNHIPWRLPDDSPMFEQLKPLVSHMSHLTTAYVDFALNQYVELLKQSNLWADTLLIIVGDHGIAAPCYYQQDERSDIQQAQQRSHVPLLISGGFVEQTLSDLKQPTVVHEEYVSQADIAALLAYVIGLSDFQSFGEVLGVKRIAPVVVDLGKDYFFPELKMVMQLNSLLNINANVTEVDERQKFHILYYRAVLHLLNRSALLSNVKQR